jgi:hypothetical protein
MQVYPGIIAALAGLFLAASPLCAQPTGNNTTGAGNSDSTTETSNQTPNGCGSISLTNNAPTGSTALGRSGSMAQHPALAPRPRCKTLRNSICSRLAPSSLQPLR